MKCKGESWEATASLFLCMHVLQFWWWQSAGKNKVDSNLMRCLRCLVLRDIKKMNDCMRHMSAWDEWNSKQMIMSCRERQAETWKGGKLICVSKFCVWDAQKSLCTHSHSSHFHGWALVTGHERRECWERYLSGSEWRETLTTIRTGREEEQCYNRFGSREIPLKNAFMTPGSNEMKQTGKSTFFFCNAARDTKRNCSVIHHDSVWESYL